jgi:diguanylate cyclase (GGDEF)-like protein/putative nucleotidyltransferase with HDIG domain
MRLLDSSDSNRALKGHWFFIALLATAALPGIIIAVIRPGWIYTLITFPIIAAIYLTSRISFERLKAKTREAEDLSRLHLATAEALATAIDAKDQTTHCHVRRMQIYADGMGKLLALSAPEVSALKAGALLHDVGKLAVPDHILNKPGVLTPAEFEKTKIHTVVGAELLSRVEFPYPVLPIIRHHHERWDGRGYPDGLKEEQIPVTARIMSVVDCYDSAREDRPFRPGKSREDALDLLHKGTGSHFDPRIVDLFVANLEKFEAEIAAQGLAEQLHLSQRAGGPIAAPADATEHAKENKSFRAYNQIRNAHREVYALYEIARMFGSSLEVENTLSTLVHKVGHIVPFDTCVVYLFDEAKGFAETALAVGLNADAMQGRSVARGEGVTGFALANRRSVNRIHPSLDFVDGSLDGAYGSMAALPLYKDELLLGALSVYSVNLQEYSDDQIRLLETVTRLASDALANAVNHARAESNALTDPLTGLPNARSLQLRFEQEVARARRTGSPFQLIMLDLDDFKLVNDTFGHKFGDRMLREVAALVHAQFREYDFLARYAGDEFVAIVPDVAADQVGELRERIERAVSDFSIEVRSQGSARVGISIGWALFGPDGETLDQLLVAADEAMYQAKSTHKGVIFRAPATPLEPAKPAQDSPSDDRFMTSAVN